MPPKGPMAILVFLLAIGAAKLSAQASAPLVLPLGGTIRINADYGAHGPGPVSDPNAYFSGQYHLGVDLAATAGDKVYAPVTGTIVYHHQLRNFPREERLLDTFFVLRGVDGRDYIIAHAVCTACPVENPVGDDDVYIKAKWRSVRAGEVIGLIGDLKAEAKRLKYSGSVGNHLHIGVVEGRMVDNDGKLKPAYRGGDWSRLLYDKDEDANPVTAIAKAKANGFVDPATVFRGAKPATATSSATPTPPQPLPVSPATLPNLQTGAYVYNTTPCGSASNATLQWWNGQFFSAGRMTNQYPVYSAPGKFIARSQNFETGELETVQFSVLNQREYMMGSARYRHCTDASLPTSWRNSTPKASNSVQSSPATQNITTVPKLTVIRAAPTSGCTQSFDLGRTQVFAHTWNESWRAGINGVTATFSLADSKYDERTGAFTLFSKDRRTSIRAQPTGKSASTRNYDADIVDVTLTTNGSTSSVKAYRICPPGD